MRALMREPAGLSGAFALLGAIVVCTYLVLNMQRGHAARNRPPIVDLSLADGDVARLITRHVQAVHDHPDDPAAWLLLGMTYDANAMYEQAIECYERSTALDSNRAKPWYYMAVAQGRLAQTPDAVQAMRRCIEVEDRYAAAHWQLGYWLLELNEVDEAKHHFARAMELAPGDPAGFVGMARAHLQHREYEQAAQVLADVITWAPWNAAYARHLLGIAYRQLGREDEADVVWLGAKTSAAPWPSSWIDDLGSLRVDPLTRLDHASMLLQTGRIDDAVMAFEQLAEKQADDPVVLANLGSAYRAQDEHQLAMNTFHRVLELQPGSHQAHYNLAMCVLALREDAPATRRDAYRDQALDHLQQCLKVNPYYAPAHGALARLYVEQEDVDRAINAYRQAVRDEQYGGVFLAELGDLYLSQQRWDEAAHTLERSLVVRPGDVHVLLDFAEACIRLRWFDQAADALERAERIDAESDRLASLKALLKEAREHSDAVQVERNRVDDL